MAKKIEKIETTKVKVAGWAGELGAYKESLDPRKVAAKINELVAAFNALEEKRK